MSRPQPCTAPPWLLRGLLALLTLAGLGIWQGGHCIDDFDIMVESNDLAVNKYMLMQAEARFGDGDGVFTVGEQRAAFGANYDLFNGGWRFRESNRLLRLGLEFVF